MFYYVFKSCEIIERQQGALLIVSIYIFISTVDFANVSAPHAVIYQYTFNYIDSDFEAHLIHTVTRYGQHKNTKYQYPFDMFD